MSVRRSAGSDISIYITKTKGSRNRRRPAGNGSCGRDRVTKTSGGLDEETNILLTLPLPGQVKTPPAE